MSEVYNCLKGMEKKDNMGGGVLLNCAGAHFHELYIHSQHSLKLDISYRERCHQVNFIPSRCLVAVTQNMQYHSNVSPLF